MVWLLNMISSREKTNIKKFISSMFFIWLFWGLVIKWKLIDLLIFFLVSNYFFLYKQFSRSTKLYLLIVFFFSSFIQSFIISKFRKDNELLNKITVLFLLSIDCYYDFKIYRTNKAMMDLKYKRTKIFKTILIWIKWLFLFETNVVIY